MVLIAAVPVPCSAAAAEGEETPGVEMGATETEGAPEEAAALPAGLSIQAVPSTIDLSLARETKATVLVTNGGDEKASRLVLRPAADGAWPERATIMPRKPLPLQPGQTRAYTLSLPPWGSSRNPSPLTLVGRFEEPESVRQVAAASLTLTAPPPLEREKVAAVDVKANLSTLRSGETQQVYLVVDNKSAQTLTVKEVVAAGPDFIEFTKRPKDVRIDAGEVSVLAIDAKADSKVDPGEYQLVFRLPTEVGGANLDLVASQTAKVGVTGETEILTLLGVPSLLLLPGFLLLATAAILWRVRFMRKDWDAAAFPLQLKEPEFWVVAVVASFLMVLFAKKVNDIDLLGRYGLDDLVTIWLESIGAGLLLYVPIVWAYNHKREERVPATDDSPPQVLRKLAKQGLNARRPRISYDAGAGAHQFYLAQSESERRPSTWAFPRVEFSWTNDVDPILNERIQEQLNRGFDAALLADLLEEGTDEKKLTVSFAGGLSPLAVPKEKIGLATPTVVAGEV